MVIAMFLIGCTNKNTNEFDLNQVTRVDVEVVKKEEYGTLDKETKQILESILLN